MRLAEFSVRQPVAALMLFLAVILLGCFSLALLPVDLFPEIEPPVVSILTTWPGASASDVESEVTQRIEDQVNGVNNLDTLTSKSVDNLSVVSCRFDWGTDLANATNDLRDRLELARRKLPDDAETPVLYKFSSATAPVMFLTVTARENWPRLYRLADKVIADELRRVPGVGAILIYGGLRRRINVYFDRARLEGFGLSLEQVNRVLAAQNLNLPAGAAKVGPLEYYVRVPGRYASAGEMSRTVIGSHQGRPVRLGEVAQVADAFEPEELLAWSGRRPAVVLLLQKQSGRNTVAVVEEVRERLAKLSHSLPGDVKIQVVMDNAENILSAVANLRFSLLAGIALVTLVTWIFLRRVKSSVIIALTIPFSLLIAFILMQLNGYSVNLVSLMSLAIACGMVVDNGIVVLENIVRHLERGGRPGVAAVLGAQEMGLAIVASTATTVVVFLPMVFLTGLVGVIFKQLAFVIAVTLGASLFTALSMTPMLASRWLRGKAPASGGAAAPPAPPGRLAAAAEHLFTGLDEGYARLLAWSLERRWLVAALAGAALLSAVSMAPFLSTSFMPEQDSGDVSVDFRLEEGTRVEETKKVVERVVADVMGVVRPAEFRSLYAWCGQSEEGIGVALGFDESPNAASLGFKLVDPALRERSATAIAGLLRERIQRVPGITQLRVLAVDPVSSILSGTGAKPLVVEVQGADLEDNRDVAARLAAGARQVPGLADVTVSQKDPRPEIWVEVDRDKASLLRLPVGVVAQQVRNYLYGYKTSEFRDGGDNYDIFTRFSDADKDRLDQLLQVPVFTSDGRRLRLGDVAQVSEQRGPIEVERKNLQKVVRVEAALDGISLGQARQALERVMDGLNLPPGVTLAFGGDVEEQDKAFRDLGILLALGILLTYMVMAALFGNFRDPLIIMFAVPFAFVGVIWAFRLTGVTLGVITFMGVIMLLGIVVNNAIVLLDYTRLLGLRGVPLREAVVQAGRDRLRPVLMTTLTTFFGMLPMAVSRAQGAETWNPLGITILGGLSISSLVTLVLIPVVYYTLESRRQRRAAA
ncbi:MAG: efflux RND transporter permease subunit [Deltaproteobacteria bacterium]|nr:efflux RND transporter permease subunit [Deltaproteobacteria bacterium]